MNHNRIDTLTLFKLERDSTALSLQDTETGVRHGRQETLPGKAA